MSGENPNAPLIRPTNLLRKLSSGTGIRLTTGRANVAVYAHSLENRRTALAYIGKSLQITDAELAERARRRSPSPLRSATDLSGGDALGVVQSLLVDSLAPLTVSHVDELAPAAVQFLSAYSGNAALWDTVPPVTGAMGGTAMDDPDGDGVSPATAFLRLRYPQLRFEVYVDRPASDLRSLLLEHGKTKDASAFTLRSSWQAYLKAGNGLPSLTPLVGTGTLEDVIEFVSVGSGGEEHLVPLISQRKFMVERIVSAQHFRPEALPLQSEESTAKGGGLMAPIRKFVRESDSLVSSLLAFSALLASINPLIESIFGGASNPSPSGLSLSSLSSSLPLPESLSSSFLSSTTTAARTYFAPDPRIGAILSIVIASLGSVCALSSLALSALKRAVSVVEKAELRLALMNVSGASLDADEGGGDGGDELILSGRIFQDGGVGAWP